MAVRRQPYYAAAQVRQLFPNLQRQPVDNSSEGLCGSLRLQLSAKI